MVEFILDGKLKKQICRQVLENLNEWFEDISARENYINSSEKLPFFAYKTKNDFSGFLCLKPTSTFALELVVMGVKKECQRSGIGSQLFYSALNYAKQNNYEFIQVKTVKQGVYPEYDITNKFYKKVGFKELEVLSTLWDKNNPCQLYIMSIK